MGSTFLGTTMAPTVQWERRQPNDIIAGYNINSSMYLDSFGNTYIAYICIYTLEHRTDIVVYKVDSNGCIIWTFQRPSMNFEYNDPDPSITVNQQGDIYVVYEIDGTIDGGDKYGKTDIVVLKLDPNGQLVWIRQRAILNTLNYNVHPSIAVDHCGDLCVSYNHFMHKLGNISVLKLDLECMPIWISHDVSHDDTIIPDYHSMAIDSNNHIYLAYHVHSIDVPIDDSCDDSVIHKLDTNGQTLWVKKYPIMSTSARMSEIKIDHANNCYVIYTLVTDDVCQIIITKLDTHGNVAWVIQRPTLYQSLFPHLSVDLQNDIYVTYEMMRNINMTDITQPHIISLFKIDASGHLLWTHNRPILEIANSNDDSRENYSNININIDNIGQIYINYETKNTDVRLLKLIPPMEYRPMITTDTENFIYYTYYTNTYNGQASGAPSAHGAYDVPDGLSNAYGYDIVIKKKDTNGKTIWSLRDPVFNTDHDSLNPAIVTYGSYCYVVYQTAGVTSGGSLSYPYDIVVLKLDSDGKIIWIQQQPTYNTNRTNESPSFDVDSHGNLYVAYQTCLTLDTITKYDIVIFKMDSDGIIEWIRRNCNVHQSNYSPYLRCDKINDAIYIAYVQQMNEGEEYSDIKLLKINSDGKIIKSWKPQQSLFNTELRNFDPVMCLDELGQVLLCYVTHGGCLSGCHATGSYDIIICKLNSDGQVIKLLQSPAFNTCGENIHPSLSYRSGYLYVAYQTNDTLQGQDRHSDLSEIVVMKINSLTCELVWICQDTKLNTTVANYYPNLITDRQGNCYISYETAGHIRGEVTAGQGTKVVVCRLNAQGICEWIKR